MSKKNERVRELKRLLMESASPISEMMPEADRNYLVLRAIEMARDVLVCRDFTSAEAQLRYAIMFLAWARLQLKDKGV